MAIEPQQERPADRGLLPVQAPGCQSRWSAPAYPRSPNSPATPKSYAERLFKFPKIDNLTPADARTALTRPAAEEGATFTGDALDEAVTIAGGYPYFVQELGYAVWTVAAGPQITADVAAAVPAYEDKLDSSFFRVRLDGATDLQRAHLRAMAQLGSDPQKAADVAAVMGRTSTNLGPTRAELINMGLPHKELLTRSVSVVPLIVPRSVRRRPPDTTGSADVRARCGRDPEIPALGPYSPLFQSPPSRGAAE